MNTMRCFSVLAALLLLGGLDLAHGADKVLVPGEVPLTQQTVDLYQQMWEWYCEIQLTPEQRRQHTQQFITFWKNSGPDVTKPLVAGYSDMEKEWRGILKLKGAEQQRKRLDLRANWMAALRKATDEPSRFLVTVYDDAYKPGGTKNPILVAGDPPLTQAMIDVDAATVELLLDLRLTDEQRRKFRDLWIEDWKSWDATTRQGVARIIEGWANLLPTFNNHERNLQRALDQPRLLKEFRKNDSGGLVRWLLALYEAAIKPGSARNPVLVDADPPLTQLVVDRYIDYLDIMIDLSLSGGFTEPQRQVLQEYLVKDWKRMSADDRKELLGDVKRWADAAGQGTDEANMCLKALRPKVAAQLRTAPRDDQRSAWLMEVFEKERTLLKRQLAKNQAYLDALPDGRDNRPGRWEYNPNSGKYDRWVPNR
jgi:hypothetical protein